MEPGKSSLLMRLKRVPVWVWITVGIGAVGLVIAYLSYKQQQANATSGAVTNGTQLATGAIPAGGASTPAYSTDPNAYAGYGGYGAGYGPNGTDIQSELAQIMALLQSQQGTTVPGGSTPTPPQPAQPPSSGPARWPASAGISFGVSPSGSQQVSPPGTLAGILQRNGGGAVPPASGGGGPARGLFGIGGLAGGPMPPSTAPGTHSTHSIPPGPGGVLVTAQAAAPLSVSAARPGGPIPPQPGGGGGAIPPQPAPGTVRSLRLPPLGGGRMA